MNFLVVKTYLITFFFALKTNGYCTKNNNKWNKRVSGSQCFHSFILFLFSSDTHTEDRSTSLTITCTRNIKVYSYSMWAISKLHSDLHYIVLLSFHTLWSKTKMEGKKSLASVYRLSHSYLQMVEVRRAAMKYPFFRTVEDFAGKWLTCYWWLCPFISSTLSCHNHNSELMNFTIVGWYIVNIINKAIHVPYLIMWLWIWWTLLNRYCWSCPSGV